jgi:hypothetical protein
MGAVLQPEELYDELANRIAAEDGPGTKRVFRQLLDAGRPRQEIVSHISRLVEQRSPDKTLANGSEEIRWPKSQSIEPSQIEEHKKPSAGPNTPISNAADQRLDGSAERISLNPEIAGTQVDPVQRDGTSDELSPKPRITAVSEQREEPLVDQEANGPENEIRSFEERRGGLSSGNNIMPRQIGVSSAYADFSVLERLASKLQLDRDLSASEAKETAPAEPVLLTDRSSPAQRGLRAWSWTSGTILTVTSIFAVAVTAFFVLWGLYGSELEELSLVNAHRALTWLQGNRSLNDSSLADPEKPSEKTGAQQATPVRASDITAPATTAPATQQDFAGRPNTPTVPNTGATSRGTAGVPENTAPRIESAPSREAERALSPSSTPSRSEPSETDASQGPQTAGSQLPPIETETLLNQGDQFLSQSDVASARLLYQRAAEAGDGRGALRIGMTFDPVFLARLRLQGVRPDKAQAIAWYRRASALGNANAELLQRELANLSRGIGSGSGAMPSLADQRHRLPRVAAPDQGHSYGPRRALASHAKRG